MSSRRSASRALPLVVVAVASVLAGCGGHGATHAAAPIAATGSAGGAGVSAQAGATVAAPAGSAGAPAGTAAAPAGGAPATSGSGHGSPAPAASPTGPADHHEVPLDAALAKTCVQPGGTETITIHGDPYWGVVFDTRYADGKDGQTYGGMDYRGHTDATGTYIYTWTVGLAAPAGASDVEAAAVGQGVTAHKRLPFTVALRCP